MKEKTKDKLIMLYQFIGGFLIFFLIKNTDLRLITGNIILIGDVITSLFLWLGILLPFSIVLLIIFKELK